MICVLNYTLEYYKWDKTPWAVHTQQEEAKAEGLPQQNKQWIYGVLQNTGMTFKARVVFAKLYTKTKNNTGYYWKVCAMEIPMLLGQGALMLWCHIILLSWIFCGKCSIWVSHISISYIETLLLFVISFFRL